MQKTVLYKKTAPEPFTDVSLPRSIDITSFHYSLDRVFASTYSYVGETHPFFEIVYVLEGVLGATSDDKIYHLKQGQCLIHFPNEFHRHWSEEDTEPHVLNLSFYANSLDFPELHIMEPSADMRDAFISIAANVKEGLHTAQADLLNRQRTRLENWLFFSKDTKVEIPRISSGGALRYSEIVSILQEHICEQLSAEEIALLCHMSLSNLKKIFTKYAGMGVSQYFNEMKIRYSVTLLQKGMKVSDTAKKLGFQDPNYFSTVFRRVLGFSPKAYKV